MPNHKICSQCQKEFEDLSPNHSSIYCSHLCKARAKESKDKLIRKTELEPVKFREWKNVTCPKCSTIFTARFKND